MGIRSPHHKIAYRYIVLHHSASPRSTTMSDIRRWHEKNRQGVGYHWVIGENGVPKVGRNLRKMGAHCKGQGNHWGIAICITGDNTIEEHKWSEKQIEAGKELIKKIMYVIPDLALYGHKDFRPTECPGYTKEELMEMFLGVKDG